MLPVRICRFCLSFGVVAFVALAGPVLAQSPSVSEPLSLADVVGALGAVLLAVGSAYLLGLKGRFDKLEERHNKLNDALLGEYHDKTELELVISRSLAPVSIQLSSQGESLTAIHKRLDRFGVGRVTGQQPAMPSSYRPQVDEE